MNDELADAAQVEQAMFLKAVAEAADGRAKVEYLPEDVGSISDRTVALLGERDEALYTRGQLLVHVVDEAQAGAQLVHALPVPRIRPASSAFVRDRVSRVAQFVGSRGTVGVPKEIVEGICSRGQWSPLRPLSAVATCPVMRPDGSIVSREGYDPVTGVLLRLYGIEFPAIPQNPSREDALAALEVFCELLCEFPFEGSSDRAVAVAAYMLPALRIAMPVCPGIGFDATAPGSGKTTCSRGVAALADGGAEALFAMPGEDEAEAHKVIDSALLSGNRALVFDNLTGPLRSETLCALLTAPKYSFRVLGRSETVLVQNSAVVLLNGNNLALIGDLSHRVLVSRLDPGMERPDRRTFEVTDFVAHVRARRPALIAAALTIARAYLAAGCPDVGHEPWARYSDFDRLVRRPLLWLGEADVLLTITRAATVDPERQELAQLLAAVSDLRLASPITCQELAARLGEPGLDALSAALLAVAGDAGRVSVRRLGKYLARFAGRVVDEYRLVRHSSRRGVARWSVEQTRETRETREESHERP